MGAIKDIVELIVALKNRVENREFLADLREIEGKVSELSLTNANLVERNQALEMENAQLRANIAMLEKCVAEAKPGSTQLKVQLDKIIEQILLFIANAPGKITKQMAVQHFNLPLVKVDYFFDQLKEQNFVEVSSARPGLGAFWAATSEGRKYFHHNSLI
jgi:regulator of replication initiation timing